MSEKLNLSASQKKAFSLLQQFITNDTHNTFILNGYAGTGKTFLMQELGKWLHSENKPFTLVASTGRAATVLRGKTGFDARTVHSELYHFTEVDGDGEHLTKESPVDAYGQMKLVFDLRASDEQSNLYIVDEASMIGSELTADKSFAEFGSGKLLLDFLNVTGKNKIIFVGDPCQLPPINQLFSPALDADWLKNQQRSCQTATLTEIVRTKANSGILALAGLIRSYLSRTFNTRYVKLPALNKANITIYNSFSDLSKAFVNQAYNQTEQKHIAICRSNADCKRINDLVRFKKHEIPYAPLQKGDILLVTQNNYQIPLCNGDFVEILEVGEKRTRANLKFLNVRIKNIITGIDYEILLCLDVLENSLTNISKEQNRDLMIDFSRRMHYKGIKPNSSAYKESMLSDPYLNSLRATYGYAVTCHKAQGGEWEHVYLFLNKGMYHMEHSDLFRWWYTAITRAKTHLYLHNDWWIS